MSTLKSIERVATEDGSLRFLCTFESDIGEIKKSVVVSAEFISGTNRAGVRDNILRQIAVRSCECDRHSEFVREKQGLGPHKNPRHLWQHKEDVKLFDVVKRGDIERAVNEALNG